MTIPAGSDHEAAEKTYVVDGKLPFHVEDPATLDRIARIMASTGDD